MGVRDGPKDLHNPTRTSSIVNTRSGNAVMIPRGDFADSVDAAGQRPPGEKTKHRGD
jgi:hypothetical protein